MFAVISCKRLQTNRLILHSGVFDRWHTGLGYMYRYVEVSARKEFNMTYLCCNITCGKDKLMNVVG